MHPLRGWCRDRRGGLRAARDDLERPHLQPAGPRRPTAPSAPRGRRNGRRPSPSACARPPSRRADRAICPGQEASGTGQARPLRRLPGGARVSGLVAGRGASGSVTRASTASSSAPEASRTGLTERFADSMSRPQPGSNTCPPSRVGRRNACRGACLAAMSRSDRHSATRRCTRCPSLPGSCVRDLRVSWLNHAAFKAPCVRFAAGVAPAPRNTPFRLVDQPWPVRSLALSE